MPEESINTSIRVEVGPVWNKTTNSAETGLLYSNAKLSVSVIRNRADTHLVESSAITLTDPATETTPYRWRELGNGLYDVLLPASGGASFNNDATGHIRLIGSASGCYDFRSSVVEIITEDAWAERYVGTGSGARTITFHVVDVDDNDIDIQSAVVRLSMNGAVKAFGTTDVDGLLDVNVDDGTYTVAVTSATHYFGGDTITVSKDDTVLIEMSAISIAASAPGTTTGYLNVMDEDAGVPEIGIKVSLRMIEMPTGSTGFAFDNTIRVKTSTAPDGLVQWTGLVPGATYEIWRGDSTATTNKRSETTIDLAAGATYDLNSVLGKP